jgi:hypothetical protein
MIIFERAAPDDGVTEVIMEAVIAAYKSQEEYTPERLAAAVAEAATVFAEVGAIRNWFNTVVHGDSKALEREVDDISDSEEKDRLLSKCDRLIDQAEMFLNKSFGSKFASQVVFGSTGAPHGVQYHRAAPREEGEPWLRDMEKAQARTHLAHLHEIRAKIVATKTKD